jgi:hypothetical protein
MVCGCSLAIITFFLLLFTTTYFQLCLLIDMTARLCNARATDRSHWPTALVRTSYRQEHVSRFLS